MTNFLRVLRLSWRHRVRLVLSVLCALGAALCWGLNFTIVFPVLTVFEKDKTLQQWVAEKIETAETQLAFQGAEAAKHRDYLEKVRAWRPPAGDDTQQREEAKALRAIETCERRAAAERSRLWQNELLRDTIISHLPADRFETLAWLLGVVVIGVALKGVFEFGQEWLVGSVTHRTLFDLRNKFFRRVVHQDLRQLQESGGTPDVMARLTNDAEQVGNGLKVLYGRVIAEPLKALACVALACWFNWRLTLLFMIVIPLALLIMTKTSKMMKRATRKVLERMSNIYRISQETFQGLRVVKAFTMEAYERRRFHEATRDYARRSMRVITIDSLAGPIVELLGMIAVSTALMAGAYLVITGETKIGGVRLASGRMDTATLLQLFTLLAAIADPVRKLSSVYTKIQSAAAASDRLFSSYDRLPTVQPNLTGPPLPRHKESIEFRDIDFAYNPVRPILKGVSLHVNFGETVAVVGPNGSGKSTLLNLLPRFFDPDGGAVLIDGVPLREAHLRDLRGQIGIVTQDTILFDDTVKNNILYGRRGASDAEVEAAAKKAFAHDFIAKLPGRYDSPAGEVGKHLSGGEKQRIALARAILRDPSILILDEHTSQIDALSEALIQQSLKEFRKGRTVFMITHRMHLLELADRVVVLDEGEVVAQGSHHELLATCDLYRQLHEAGPGMRAA